MKHPVLALVMGLSLLTTVVMVSGCGEDVCVAGFGRCDVDESIQDQQQSGTTSSFTDVAIYSTSGAKVSRNNNVTIVIRGGKSPYTYSKSEGGGSFDESTKTVTDTYTSVQFTPPTAIENPQNYVILKAEDANGYDAEMAIVFSN